MLDKNQIHKNNRVIVYITYAIVLAFLLFNYVDVIKFVTYVLSLATPFYIAIIIAFILNIPMKKIEELLKKKVKNTEIIRGLAMTITLIFAALIIILFTSYVLPELGESITILITNVFSYSERLINNVNNILASLNIRYSINSDTFRDIITNLDLNRFLSNGSSILGEAGIEILIKSVGIVNFLFNAITSFIMALYLLANKETHVRQLKKIITYFFGYKKALNMIDIGKEANHYFNGFVAGQLLEACIFTVLMYISFIFTKAPFPELLALILGVLSLIPMFGGFIGFFICAFIVLAVEPSKLLIFTVSYLLIQQIEGNLIYPRVVGNAVGISGLYVLLSLVVFGNLFGFFGMLIAVPSMALIYAVASRVITIGLYRNNIEVTSDNVKRLKRD